MPYAGLPDEAFWKLCRESADRHLGSLYKPKFALAAGDRIATAGSCFAQHFGKWVRNSNLQLVEMEPKPAQMSHEVARRFGYGVYSARYGNIYTARQLRQLVDDCRKSKTRREAIWEHGGRWYDGLRPQTEPEGYADLDELHFHRKTHLSRVLEMFSKADVFVFTLGLTEAWSDRRSCTVFPMAPGVVAGQFDAARHVFNNFSVAEVVSDLVHVIKRLKGLNKRMRILLTVSPVPLTATASGRHVVEATTYSKSVLRVAADEVARRFAHVDYFPSYEIITNPMFGSAFYDPNLRTVTEDGVQTVMSAFFGAHHDLQPSQTPIAVEQAPVSTTADDDDLVCEEVLLEAFAQR